MVVAILFLLGVVALVVCAGLQINPFRETTTSFLVAAFVGLIGVAIVLVLLNMATNLSLIADVQARELGTQPQQSQLRKWFWAFIATAAAVVGFILVGTYISKERYVKVIHSQADEVLRENTAALDEISKLLTSGKPEDFPRIAEVERYLTNQRAGLPQLSIVYSGKFGDRPALYRANQYFPYTYPPGDYQPPYFSYAQTRLRVPKEIFLGRQSGCFGEIPSARRPVLYLHSVCRKRNSIHALV
jgi:hypothetical protein